MQDFTSVISKLPFAYTSDGYIDFDDALDYTCHLVEYIARELLQPNIYVATALGTQGFERVLNHVFHFCHYSPMEVMQILLKNYPMDKGNFDITLNKFDLPTELMMGRVYANLFEDLQLSTLVELYSLPVCKVLDDYNTGAYLEPRECIANNFTTPNKRFYGEGYYCTRYKPMATRWAMTYGGSIKTFRCFLPSSNVKKLDRIISNYRCKEDEELLIAPLPDKSCLDFLATDPDELERMSIRMNLPDVYVFRHKIPEDPKGTLKLYTVVPD